MKNIFNRSIYLISMLLLFAILSACSSQTTETNGLQEQTIEEEARVEEISIPAENKGIKVTCRKFQDCQAGEHCFQSGKISETGYCLSDAILTGKESCSGDVWSEQRCPQRCENCQSQFFKCLTVARLNMEKCVECTKNSDCKEGNSCEQYACV